MGMPNLPKLGQIKKVDARIFQREFRFIREQLSRPDTVLERELQVYESCRDCYIIYEEEKPVAGVAITSDGEIISLIGNEEYYGVAKCLLTISIAAGARKLDSYGTEKLWTCYHNCGFVPCAKVRISEPVWWKEEDGDRHYIYYWYYDIQHPAPYIHREWDVKKEDVEDFGEDSIQTRSQAEAFRDSIVAKIYKDNIYRKDQQKALELDSRAIEYLKNQKARLKNLGT